VSGVDKICAAGYLIRWLQNHGSVYLAEAVRPQTQVRHAAGSHSEAET